MTVSAALHTMRRKHLREPISSVGARCIYYRREDPATRAGSGRDHYQMILSSEGMMNDAFECGPIAAKLRKLIPLTLEWGAALFPFLLYVQQRLELRLLLSFCVWIHRVPVHMVDNLTSACQQHELLILLR